MQKGAKSFFQIDKENAHIVQRKTNMVNRKSGLYIVRKCAENIPQKVKWDTPNGKMGYPKWRNGTSQKAKWDTPNGKMGHPKRRNGIPQMVKWDTSNGEMRYPKR